MRITQKVEAEIIRLRKAGWSQRDITEHIGCCKATVRAVLINAKIDGGVMDDDARSWLSQHWGEWFIKPKPRLKRKNGYRVVYVGDKSNFRTPCRPDGVWR